MHPALSNPDILHQILVSFHSGRIYIPSAPVFGFIDYKSLFSLSLVCTTFSPHALDTLWAMVIGLDPLLQLLIDTPAVQEDVSKPVDITFDIDEDKWIRFQIYCKRIRHLVADGNSMSEATAIKLYEKQGNTPLFPNLCTLSLALNPSTTWSEVKLFLSPRIDTFQLWSRQTFSDPECDNIQQLLKKLPTVWETIGNSLLQVELNPGVPSCQLEIPTSPKLEILIVQAEIAHSDFSIISQLPTLYSLSIRLKEDDSNTLQFPFLTTGAFSNLISLTLHAPTSYILPILERIESPNMAQLGINTSSETSSWWSELSSLAIRRWAHSLQGLELVQLDEVLETPQFFQTSDNIPKLTILLLGGGFIGDILDFGFISRSSRTLTVLALGVFSENMYMSWDVLPMMRELLPFLTELRLIIRNHDIPALTIDNTSSLPSKPHPLKVLRLCSVDLAQEIPKDDLPLIARFIDHLFPRAEVVPSSDEDMFDGPLYREIQKAVVAVRKARGDVDWSPENKYDALMRRILQC